MVRRLLFLPALLVALAACGGAPAAPAPTAAPIAQPTTAVSSAEAPASAGVYPREVVHATGTARIAQRPVRIADISYHGVWTLVAFGVTPVQYQMHADRAADFRRLAQTIGANLDFVEIGDAANLEALVAAKPDLILGASYLTDPIRTELEAIAPVVDLPGPGNGGWRDNVRIIGDVLGMEQRAQELIAETEAGLTAALAPYQLDGASFAFFSPGIYDGQVYVCQDPTYAPVGILLDAGLTMASEVASLTGDVCTGVSLELLGEVLGTTDILVLSEVWGSSMAEFVANPVVAALPAIAEERYVLVSGPSDATVALDIFSPALTELVVPVLQQIGERYRATRGAETSASPTAAYPRTITDGAGQQVTLVAPPQRIAVLDPLTSLEALLALGVAPVQIGQRSFVADYLGDPLLQWPWLEAALAEAGADPERINADQTNLEAVAGARPDLIIGQSFWVDEQRELLSQVAPTLTTPLADVRAAITLLGEALALEERAAQVLADWDARLATEVEGLATSGTTVAIIRTDGEGTFTVFNTAGYGPYDMLTRAGFSVPESLAAAPKNANGLGSDFSLERLDVLDAADVIVVLGFSVDATDELLANPLFTRVPAVAAGRVVRIEQGPVAQALAIQSPLNLDTVLPVIREAAALAP